MQNWSLTEQPALDFIVSKTFANQHFQLKFI